jgi:hypothetical protein
MFQSTPSISLEIIPLYERVHRVQIPRLPNGFEQRMQCLVMSANPLVMSTEYYRARVVNHSPVPLRLYHSHSAIQHESGRILKYDDPLVLLDKPPKIVTIPPHGEAVIPVDLFGVLQDNPTILPGDYVIRVEFRSADSGEVYSAPSVSVTLTKRDIQDYFMSLYCFFG